MWCLAFSTMSRTVHYIFQFTKSIPINIYIIPLPLESGFLKIPEIVCSFLCKCVHSCLLSDTFATHKYNNNNNYRSALYHEISYKADHLWSISANVLAVVNEIILIQLDHTAFLSLAFTCILCTHLSIAKYPVFHFPAIKNAGNKMFHLL